VSARSGPDLLDEDAPLGRADLVVELLEEVESDHPVDPVAIREVERMNRKVGFGEAECLEPGKTQDVSLLLPMAEVTVVIA
jgi:hypothetical protein